MMRQSAEPGLLGRLAALVAGALLLVLGFMFSLVLFAVIAVLALIAFAYFWWKTRALRKAMRAQHPNGQVIDGEAVIVEEYRGSENNALPRDPPSESER